MAEDTKIMRVFVDLLPTHAKQEHLRPRFEKDLRDKIME